MPDNVRSQLHEYADWSFCVFKQRPEPKPAKGFWDYSRDAPLPTPPRKRHPMAFDFPRRNPNQIFFPTVHVHDGVVRAMADFDHTLYAPLDDPSLPEGSEAPASASESIAPRSKGFVRLERPMFRRRIEGSHPNRDITI